VFGSTDDSKMPTLSNFGFAAIRPCSDSRREKITDLIAKMIVSNALPISLVESEELSFVMFLNILNVRKDNIKKSEHQHYK